MQAYHKRLTSDDETIRLQAARAWSVWEGSTSLLQPDPKMIAEFGEDEMALAMARIECHYFMNDGFMSEDQLLHNIKRIRHIPAVIVQGRYDVVCPMISAWELHQAWPEAKFCISQDSGHSAFDAGNTHELIMATDHFSAG